MSSGLIDPLRSALHGVQRSQLNKSCKRLQLMENPIFGYQTSTKHRFLLENNKTLQTLANSGRVWGF